jgi:hypothetical protein
LNATFINGEAGWPFLVGGVVRWAAMHCHGAKN